MGEILGVKGLNLARGRSEVDGVDMVAGGKLSTSDIVAKAGESNRSQSECMGG